jgi:predicted phosphohydrolase
MIFQYCSDLHLEFSENKALLLKQPLQAKAKILLLAGDIVPFCLLDKHQDFFDHVSANFEHTYWIAGNHEYYGADAAGRTGQFHEKIRPNVSLLNNTIIEYEDVRLAFTTLWSKISPRHQWEIEMSLNDFSVIRFHGKKLTPAHVNQFHSDNIAFLRRAAEDGTKKTIVISHHVPTLMHYPEQYKNSPLSGAFVTELSDLIHELGFAAWIYGHHHTNTPDFTIGKTILATNQLGYVRYDHHKSYQEGKTIEVGGISPA